MKPRKAPESSSETLRRPERKWDARWDWPELWRRHQEYWTVGVEERDRFEKAVREGKGAQNLAQTFHVQDGFRITCDGQVDGDDCGNVIGYADTFKFDTHDGLCEKCRRNRADFPPRIHMTPDGIYAMDVAGPRIVPREWDFPASPEERQAEIRRRLGL